MPLKLTSKDFYYFRSKLIMFSKRFNISKEDAEEIVNDAILKALNYYDNDRGSFESLCRVILKNKVLNFKRDNATLYLLVFIDEDDDLIKHYDTEIEDNEKNKSAMEFLSKLKKELTPEEITFLDELYSVCESSNKLLISKAAKKMGITVLKGWDIFRRIQRKAKQPERELEELVFDAMVQESFYKLEIPSVQKVKFIDIGYENFLNHLNSEQLKKLNSLYDSDADFPE